MPSYRFSIRTDPELNVIHLQQEGEPDRDDLLRMKEEYARALGGVRPGFVLVHDQRAVRSFPDDAVPVGRELVEMTGAAGAAKVIRIAPESVVSRTRVSRVLFGAQPRYEEVRVATPEEAELALRAHLSGGSRR